MTEKIPLDTTCCPGACCRDVALVLNIAELTHLVRGGSKMSIALNSHIDDNGEDGRIDGLGELYKSTDDVRYKARITELAMKISNLAPDEELFWMEGACGYLEEGRCSDYPNRPRACRDLEVGSLSCRSFMEQAGIEVSVEIGRKKDH
jgi:hypothetical protein